MAKKIVVAGAKGFLGKRLVAELIRQGTEVSTVDLGDRIEDVGGVWDVFFNLAWVGKGGALRANYDVQMTNVKVGLDFYREARRLGCRRYVCMGTIGEKMARLPECQHIKSQNFIYAISKNYLHEVLNALEQPDCKVIWATLGNIYGGSDAGGNIVDYCLREILTGREAIFGPAEQPYDFVHVDDAVRALAGIGLDDRVKSSGFYVGNGRPEPLKKYLLEIGCLAGCENLIGIGKRPDDGTRYRADWFDITPLKAETGFEPRISFEEGVRGNIDSVKGAL